MEEPQSERPSATESERAITVEALTKSYSRVLGAEVQAVNGVSFSVEQGTIVGLIGPNGAGKSTIIQCLLGLLHPDQGTISVFGKAPRSRDVQRRIGYLSEEFETYSFLTAEEVLRFLGGLSGRSDAAAQARIEDVLNLVGLSGEGGNKVQSFSKGMNQRLGMAQALLHDPELLILDEPFTGLDPEGRRRIIDLLLEKGENGTTVFFSSHILADIERLCDRILIIDQGEVVQAGTLDDLLQPEWDTLEELYMEVVPSSRR